MSWFTETMVALHRCQIYGECGPFPHWAILVTPVVVAIIAHALLARRKKG
jgi:hypothetical protein